MSHYLSSLVKNNMQLIYVTGTSPTFLLELEDGQDQSWQQLVVRNKYHVCPNCKRIYGLEISLIRHLRQECNESLKYKCPYCSRRGRQKIIIERHIERDHSGFDVYVLTRQPGGFFLH